MQIVGIEPKSGEFQGSHYENYLIYAEEKIEGVDGALGKRTEILKFKKKDLIEWLQDEKNIGALYGKEYSRVLYDKYNKPIMLMLVQK